MEGELPAGNHCESGLHAGTAHTPFEIGTVRHIFSLGIQFSPLSSLQTGPPKHLAAQRTTGFGIWPARGGWFVPGHRVEPDTRRSFPPSVFIGKDYTSYSNPQTSAHAAAAEQSRIECRTPRAHKARSRTTGSNWVPTAQHRELTSAVLRRLPILPTRGQ
jgi:hypothetical protein